MPRDKDEPRSNPSGKDESVEHDETFKRHGPEPPEHDSGPSPSGDEMFRNPGSVVRNGDPDQQVD
jgi:hypothetical protein